MPEVGEAASPGKEGNLRSPDFIIKIAADSIDRLRRSDVERVLENCSDVELGPTAKWIVENRADLAVKVEDEVAYQEAQRFSPHRPA